MKYLEDNRLAELTSQLTDKSLGGGRRLHGRLEAFIMKRAGNDKKYAHALGERYVQEMEQVESQMASYQSLMRHRSEELPRRPTNEEAIRKRSQSVGFNLDEKKVQPPTKQARTRASSFDVAAAVMPQSDLGDFQETGTRRLMTDLILTLNASFPDYDFADVRPSHFTKVPMSSCVSRVNERLSEFASQQPDSSFLSKMWTAVDNVVSLSDSVVYSFAPSERDDVDDGFLAQTLVEDDDEATPLWSFNFLIVNKHMKRILLFCCVETMHSEERLEEEPEEEEFVNRGHLTENNNADMDFDLDPADVAGGIPLVI
jgi:hypothetical protein